jgi:hypothetical protein
MRLPSSPSHPASDAGSDNLNDDREGMANIDGINFDDVMAALGTGYATASSKRNADFHNLFKSVPEDDYLIEGEL